TLRGASSWAAGRRKGRLHLVPEPEWTAGPQGSREQRAQEAAGPRPPVGFRGWREKVVGEQGRTDPWNSGGSIPPAGGRQRRREPRSGGGVHPSREDRWLQQGRKKREKEPTSRGEMGSDAPVSGEVGGGGAGGRREVAAVRCSRSVGRGRGRKERTGSRDANRWVDGHLFADFHLLPTATNATKPRAAIPASAPPPPPPGPPSRSSPTPADCKCSLKCKLGTLYSIASRGRIGCSSQFTNNTPRFYTAVFMWI
ncbi:hypothetical protein BRADI_4g29214v3, partial [Brachypodium distachyon]